MNRFTLPPARLAASIAVTVLSVASARAEVVIANWTSETGGTLNGVAFTFTGGNSLSTANLGGVGFTGYEQVGKPTVVEVFNNALWSVSFASPITNLYLYDRSWRGGPIYTFSNNFTVVVGNETAIANSPTLTLPGQFFDFQDGVLQFAGPISALSISNVSGADGGRILLTFGADAAAAPVPEPGTLALWAAGVGMLAGLGAKRRASAAA